MIRGLIALALAATIGCASEIVVPIGTPVRATLDVSRFDRVLVPGFVTEPGDPIDTNLEMTRLLRSQLTNTRQFHVIAADTLAVDGTRLGDTPYWRQVGEEYGRPLIVTGVVSFHESRDSQSDPSSQGPPAAAFHGERTRTVFMIDRQRFVLQSTFVFVDGTTGTTLYSKALRQEVFYDPGEDVPALAAYFDLVDRMLPDFLKIVSDELSYSIRTLLK